MDFFVIALTGLAMSIGTEVVGLNKARYNDLLNNEIKSIERDTKRYLLSVEEYKDKLVNADLGKLSDKRMQSFGIQVEDKAISKLRRLRRNSFSDIHNLQRQNLQKNSNLYKEKLIRRKLYFENEIKKLKEVRPYIFSFSDDFDINSYRTLLEGDFVGSPIFILTPTLTPTHADFLRSIISLNVGRKEQFIYIIRSIPVENQLAHWFPMFQKDNTVLYSDPLGKPFFDGSKKNIPFLVFNKFVAPNENYSNYSCYLEEDGCQSQYNSNCCEMISIRTACDVLRAHIFNVSNNIENGIFDVFRLDILKKEFKVNEIIRHYYNDLPFAYFDIKKRDIDNELSNYLGSFKNRIAIVDSMLIESRRYKDFFYSSNENETFNNLALESLELSKKLLTTIHLDINNKDDNIIHERILDEIFTERINIFLRAIKMTQEAGKTINRTQISNSISKLYEKPSVINIGRGTLILQTQKVVELYNYSVESDIKDVSENLLASYIRSAMRLEVDSLGGTFKDTELRKLYNSKMLLTYKKVNFNMQGIAPFEPVRIDLLHFMFSCHIEGIEHLMNRYTKMIANQSKEIDNFVK